jgi:hypothetical protein
MSVSQILNANGVISNQYLPSDPDPHPYVENPFQSPVDGGNQPLTNLGSLLCNGNLGVAVNKYIAQAGATLQVVNEDTGVVAVSCNDGVQIVPSSTTGTGQLTIANGSATVGGQTSYEFYTPGATSGGLTVGDFALYGYLNGGDAREIFQTDRFGANIDLGSATAVGGCVVSVNGTLGAGRVYDTVYNKPDDTKVQQITGTLATLVIPPTGGANPAKTLATLDVSSLGSFNSFVVYLKLDTGNMTTPDATAYNYQYFLSAGLDGNLDETKGCLVGYTGPLLNGQSDFLPYTTLLYRSTTPISTLYLNVQVQIGQTHSGSTWTSPTWTADVYCSTI